MLALTTIINPMPSSIRTVATKASRVSCMDRCGNVHSLFLEGDGLLEDGSFLARVPRSAIEGEKSVIKN